MYFQRIWISCSVCSNFLSCGTVKKQSNYVCKQHFYIKPELFFFPTHYLHLSFETQTWLYSASQHPRWAGRTSLPSNFFGRQRIYFILSVLYTAEGIVSEQSNYFNLIIRHTWLAKGRCAKWSLVFIWIPTCLSRIFK